MVPGWWMPTTLRWLILSTPIHMVSHVLCRELSIGGSIKLSTLLWVGHITRIMGWGWIGYWHRNLVWHVINMLSRVVVTLSSLPMWVWQLMSCG